MVAFPLLVRMDLTVPALGVRRWVVSIPIRGVRASPPTVPIPIVSPLVDASMPGAWMASTSLFALVSALKSRDGEAEMWGADVVRGKGRSFLDLAFLSLSRATLSALDTVGANRRVALEPGPRLKIASMMSSGARS